MPTTWPPVLTHKSDTGYVNEANAPMLNPLQYPDRYPLLQLSTSQDDPVEYQRQTNQWIADSAAARAGGADAYPQPSTLNGVLLAGPKGVSVSDLQSIAQPEWRQSKRSPPKDN